MNLFCRKCYSHRLTYFYYFLIKTPFFKAVLNSQKNWGESTEIFHVSLAPCMHYLPHYQYPPPEWYNIMITQSPQFPWELILGVVHSVGVDRCIKTCIHHYGIIQSFFTTPEILCAPSIHPYTLSLGNHWCLHCLYILFQNILGIIHQVALSDWGLSLCNMHLRLL